MMCVDATTGLVVQNCATANPSMRFGNWLISAQKPPDPDYMRRNGRRMQARARSKTRISDKLFDAPLGVPFRIGRF